MSNLDKELYDAVSRNKLAEVRILLGRGASVNSHDYYGDTPLHKAAKEGYVEIAELLIRNKADVNAPDNVGDTPLHKGINAYYYSGHNNLVMVENLIRLGANVLVSNNKEKNINHKTTELRAKILNGKSRIKWQNQELKHIRQLVNNLQIP